MSAVVNLYSEKQGEISKFLSNFYSKNIFLKNDLKWEKIFENPVEIADIACAVIDNRDAYRINIWVSLDSDAFIYVSPDNVDKLIRYLYERYPY